MVITSLLGAIPLIGPDILFLLWGGFSIDDITLHRFYSIHYTLPFVLLAVSLLHVFFLHEFGSSNPLGVSARLDNIPLMPYYGVKDLYFIVLI
jgi:quinol-cytochrome oxidoreductase complex cytochrome b subunit